jgi:molecular chaperone GrpE
MSDDDSLDDIDPRDLPGGRPRRSRTMAETLGIPPALGRHAADATEKAAGDGDRRAGQRRRAKAEPGGDGDRKELVRQLDAAEEAVEKARAEAKEAKEQYVRIAAEMDNLRKRHRQEQASQLQYGNAQLLEKLLPVLDNFHRALEHAPDAAEGEAPQEWVAGLTMVLRQLEELLAAEGVTPIDAVGQDFDPNVHQAVIAEPSDEHEEGKVIDELQRGYMLNDRLLRPSMVKVSRNS